jgi:hypothetical protein
LKSLRTLFEKAEKIFADDNTRAGEVAGPDLPLEADRAVAAAFVVVARVVLNLDETIMRD